MNDVLTYQMFIDGEWVASPEIYEIKAPATDEVAARSRLRRC
ncbi:hypothetical protein [Nocardioides sp. B-3]|nr:hypothetical protein [Nocardioides sp. B-3]